jgi:hypothetical protein
MDFETSILLFGSARVMGYSVVIGVTVMVVLKY